MARLSNPYADRGLLERVCRRLVGRREEVKAVLAALAAGRNVLLEGPPGTSKSTILRAIAEESGLSFYLVEGNASVTPQKLVGTFNPAKVMANGFKPEYFEEGPLVRAMREGGILYIEELNRMPEEAYNALLMAAEEREVSVPRLGVVRAEPSFRLVAAVNPYDDVGVGRISRALMDRFVKIRLGYQSRDEEVAIVRLRTGSRREWLVELAVDLARETRVHPDFRMGASVRGAIDMVLIAESMAELSGGELGYGDLERAAVMAFSSKVWPVSPDVDVEAVIKDILRRLLGAGGRGGVGSSGKLKREGEEGAAGSGDRDVNSVKRLSEVAPRRAAAMVGPEDLQALSRQGLEGLDAMARILYFLPEELRRLAKTLMLSAILRLQPIAGGYRRRGPLEWGPCWDCDDIDVDCTVDRFLDEPLAPPTPIAVRHSRGDRAVILVVDRSLSMSGFKMAAAALAAAVLTYVFPGEDLAVVAFNDNAEVLKRVDTPLDREALVKRVLSLEPSGYTNFYEALECALREAERAGYGRARAVMITDGEWTAGPNPLPLAERFSGLSVISVPSRWWRFAREMAVRGGGRFYLLRRLRDVPTAIMEISE